jgi:hypothetical protein
MRLWMRSIWLNWGFDSVEPAATGRPSYHPSVLLKRVDGVTVFPILSLKWDDDAYSKGLAGLVRGFVGRKKELPPEDLNTWYDEFARLSEAGRYFFSSNRYIFRALKPST